MPWVCTDCLTSLDARPPVAAIAANVEAPCDVCRAPSLPVALNLVDRLAVLAIEKGRRPAKDWNLCPYEKHADDCECRGMGGDR